MLFVLPTRMDVIMPYRPVANYGIIALNTLFFVLQLSGQISDDNLAKMALYGWENQIGFFTMTLLHGGPAHFFFNNITLWVFGNAVNSKVGNAKYIILYLVFAWVSSAAQVALNPESFVIGASGAISGVMAYYFSIYPRNYINIFFWVLFYWGFKRIAGYWLAIFFILGEVKGAVSGTRGIAYGCHFGGFAIGFLSAFAFIKFRWIKFQSIDQDHIFHRFVGRDNSDEVSEKMIQYAASLGQKQFNVQMGSITEQKVNGLQLSKMLETKRLTGGHLIEAEEGWIPIVEFLKVGETLNLTSKADQTEASEEYYVHKDGQNYGPYNIEGINDLYGTDQIGRDQLLYRKLDNSWCKVSDLI